MAGGKERVSPVFACSGSKPVLSNLVHPTHLTAKLQAICFLSLCIIRGLILLFLEADQEGGNVGVTHALRSDSVTMSGWKRFLFFRLLLCECHCCQVLSYTHAYVHHYQRLIVLNLFSHWLVSKHSFLGRDSANFNTNFRPSWCLFKLITFHNCKATVVSICCSVSVTSA